MNFHLYNVSPPDLLRRGQMTSDPTDHTVVAKCPLRPNILTILYSINSTFKNVQKYSLEMLDAT